MKHNPFLIHASSREELEFELSKRGVVPPATGPLAKQQSHLLLHMESLARQEASLLREDMQSCGAEAVITAHIGDPQMSDVLLIGSQRQVDLALQRASVRSEGLRKAAVEALGTLAMRDQFCGRRELVCGSHVLPIGERTLVMGILNVTPDSFSDGGRYIDLEQAVSQARSMVEAGADLIDIGGESTRPGSQPVEAAEELDRVLPIIRALSKELSVPLSIDTYKSEVADRAIQAGAHIINDVWGAKRDRRMAEVAKQHNVPIILMHNRDNTDYRDFFSDFVKDLRESVQIALEAGVRHDQIILDPGIGFAKSLDQNLETMRRLDDLVALGYPVLLATSRKRMIGHVLDLPVNERVEGTAATVALGVAKGCHMIRVHDVKEMKRVTKMMDAMLKGGISVG